MVANQFDIRPLDYDTSIDKLRATRFGRVSVFHDGLPLILPVTFRLVDDHLTILTVNTDDAVRLTRDTILSFEADEFSPSGGWSVNVVGFATATLGKHARTARLKLVSDQDGECAAGAEDLRGVDIALDLVVGRLIEARSAIELSDDPLELAMDVDFGLSVSH